MKEYSREDQILFTGCALVTEEMLSLGAIKEEFVEQAREILSQYRRLITDIGLIEAFEDSKLPKNPP